MSRIFLILILLASKGLLVKSYVKVSNKLSISLHNIGITPWTVHTQTGTSRHHKQQNRWRLIHSTTSAAIWWAFKSKCENWSPPSRSFFFYLDPYKIVTSQLDPEYSSPPFFYLAHVLFSIFIYVFLRNLDGLALYSEYIKANKKYYKSLTKKEFENQRTNKKKIRQSLLITTEFVSIDQKVLKSLELTLWESNSISLEKVSR
jgi:hypothetical protein